jgi:hypothetical protein
MEGTLIFVCGGFPFFCFIATDDKVCNTGWSVLRDRHRLYHRELQELQTRLQPDRSLGPNKYFLTIGNIGRHSECSTLLFQSFIFPHT